MADKMEIISKAKSFIPNGERMWKLNALINSKNSRNEIKGERLRFSIDAGNDGYIIRTNSDDSRDVNVASIDEVHAFFDGINWGGECPFWVDLRIEEADGHHVLKEAFEGLNVTGKTYARFENEECARSFKAGVMRTRRIQ